MAQPKNDAFLKPEVRLAAYSKAVSHPARVALLKVLAEREECTCGELVREMPLAQATVSQHLRALCDAGLVTVTPSGPRSLYTLNPEGMQAFRRQIRFLFAQIAADEDA